MYISTNEDKNILIGGDFNTILDIHLDKKAEIMIHIDNVDKSLSRYLKDTISYISGQINIRRLSNSRGTPPINYQYYAGLTIS